jgi:type IV secretory pathway TraG/TraD family ATPase VirD4
MARQTSVSLPRRLSDISSEADLLPFRQTDPFMLPSALHGDARFGWLQHIWRAGMFRGQERWERGSGYPLSAMFFQGGGYRIDGTVLWPHEGHRLIVGAPGGGKFTCAIAPLLLSDDGANALVIDPKGGEAFQFTAVYRNHLASGDGAIGVRILDPCGVYRAQSDSESLNPMDLLDPNNPNLVGDTDKLVDALVVTSGHEREPVWAMSAKKVLRAIILHIATYPSAARRSRRPTLMDVQHVISEGVDEAILLEMARNPIAEGLVIRGALEISDLKVAEGTWRGVKFQIDASLAFLDNPGIRRTLADTSFDVSDLRNQRLLALNRSAQRSLRIRLRAFGSQGSSSGAH